MSHPCHIHVTSMSHLRHIYVTSFVTFMSHHIYVTSMSHLCDIFVTSTSHLRHIYVTSMSHLCHIYVSCVLEARGIYKWVALYMWMSHTTSSCRSYEWVMHVVHHMTHDSSVYMNESRCTYEWVLHDVPVGEGALSLSLALFLTHLHT